MSIATKITGKDYHSKEVDYYMDFVPTEQEIEEICQNLSVRMTGVQAIKEIPNGVRNDYVVVKVPSIMDPALSSFELKGPM